MLKNIAVALAFVTMWGGLQGALAQTFPTKPIRAIVPFGPGGSTDTISRTVSERASQTLGQPIVIENRPGAGASAGPGIVANSPPDGYSLLLATPSQIPVPIALKTSSGYDPARDFAPVAKLADEPIVIMGSREVPAKDFKELIVWLKANPGKANYSSAGQGSLGHLAGELFKLRAGVDVIHVPYRGGAPATTALMSNEVQLSLTSVGSARAVLDRVRVYAVLSDKRSPVLPDVPTAAEAGVQDLIVKSWVGVFVPSATPPEIVERLRDAYLEAARAPAVRQRLETLGVETAGTLPDAFSAAIEKETKRWIEVIDRAGIKLN